MKLHIDKEADALYLHIDDATIVESNEANQVVGIEILYLSKRSPDLNLSIQKLVIS